MLHRLEARARPQADNFKYRDDSSGRMLRLTDSGSGSRRGRAEPSSSRTGPATFANRLEQLVIATRALALLMPRDRDIMNCSPIEEQAARLGLSYDSAAKARLRALERFRKTFELMARSKVHRSPRN
jgi:hypothetical protein